jgi:DNA excision repair protein ERCC-2
LCQDFAKFTTENTVILVVGPENSNAFAKYWEENDLTSGEFQKRDRTRAGTQGHKRVQRSWPDSYQTEVEVAFRVEGEEPPMEVRGRIDGLYATRESVIIEEIKTTTLALDLVSEEHNHLHWAQARCYAFMLARPG